MWSKAVSPVRTLWSKPPHARYHSSPFAIALARSAPGLPLTRQRPRVVASNVPSSLSRNTPRPASARIRRYSDGACVEVDRASSWMVRGPSVSRSAIPSFAAT